MCGRMEVYVFGRTQTLNGQKKEPLKKTFFHQFARGFTIMKYG